MPQQRVVVRYEKASESERETTLPPRDHPPMSMGRAQQIKYSIRRSTARSSSAWSWRTRPSQSRRIALAAAHSRKSSATSVWALPSTSRRKYVVFARGRPPQLSPQLLQVGVDPPPRLAQSGTVDHDLFIAFDAGWRRNACQLL